MALKLAALGFLVICMAKPSCGQEIIFDVTKYGAMADGKTDNSKAFTDAWNAACAHGGTVSFAIPQGTFMLGPVSFSGPCSNNTSPRVEIKGKLLAPISLASIPSVGWIEFRALNGLTVGGGGTVDGQGAESWKLTTCPGRRTCDNLPLSLRFIKINNATIANLTLLNSKGFHMGIQRSAFITVRYLNIIAPGNSPNTDGIHISDTSNIDLASLTIGTGDDCISIGPGNNNVSISGVTCSPGHGISVGSLGKYMDDKDVVGVKVRNCTISNAVNGVRIKTWPGSPPGQASDFTFEDIIINNVSHPIIIDQGYCPMNQCSSKPSQVKIKNVTFKQIRGTSNRDVAVSLTCSPTVPCENVQLQDINLRYVTAGASNVTSLCYNVKGLVAGTQIPDPCL